MSLEKRVSPQISVVVRARNESDTILTTLNSLRLQTFKNFEVIIVDNNSTDDTAEKVGKFIDRSSFLFCRSVGLKELGRGKALHAGVVASKTEWIACLDADSIASPHWLEAIINFTKESPNYVGGSGEISFIDGYLHHKILYKLIRNTIYSVSSNKDQGWLSLANSWFRKSAFLRSGGTNRYPEDVVADDRILALQIRKYGKIAFVKDAKVETENWLIQKPEWLSNFHRELEQVRQITDVENPSLFQNLIRPVSKSCQMIDSFKRGMNMKLC